MLCRRCDVAAGTYTPITHAPRVCRRCGVQGVTCDSLCRPCWKETFEAPLTVVAPVPLRERLIDGEWFDVVWDGCVYRDAVHRGDDLTGQPTAALADDQWPLHEDA
jgi:hypothetical protein